MKSDVIIIGAGLLGSMTAKYLRSKGLTTFIIDSKEPMAASKCSFGIWKDGWISPHIKERVEQGLPILDEFAGISEIDFQNTDKNIIEKMKYVSCAKILNESIHVAKVNIIRNKLVVVHRVGGFETFEAKKAVIVCAGVWTYEILHNYNSYNNPSPIMDRHWGTTLEFRGKINVSKYGTWAPYKQNVLLKKNPELYVFGDGATVKNPKDNDPRLSKVEDRLVRHYLEVSGKPDLSNVIAVKQGYRPYLLKSDMINQHDKSLFSATGGAKSSTILCGWVAKTLFDKINIQN